MDAISFTYATRNVFLSVAINHSFTGGDVWGPRNTGRSFGADDNQLPQAFLETSLDLQGIKEIFPCSFEMFPCSSCYCCPALYTTREWVLFWVETDSILPTLSSHSALAVQLSLLSPKYTQHFPTSGTLHRVYLLPVILFSDSHVTHFFPPCVKVFVPTRCSQNTLYLKCKLFPTILNHPSLLYHPPYDCSHLINYIFYLSVFCCLHSRR